MTPTTTPDLQIRGEVLSAGDPGFDETAAIWDGRHGQRPALIARCLGAADVRRAIRYARQNNLEISVRCGGHNPNDYAINDGGIVLDLRLMNSVQVDPVARRARVAGGALAGDVVREAAEFGLVPVTGMLPAIGFCGIALNGGEGFFSHRYGMVCDSIVGATLVTADGELIRCSPDERPELLWGMRGAGPNFGVVTEIEIALYDLPDSVLAGMITWTPTPEQLPGFLASLLSTLQATSDDLYPVMIIGTDETGAAYVAVALCHIGAADEAEAEITTIRAMATATDDTIARAPYLDAVNALNVDIDEAAGFVDGLCRRWTDYELTGSSETFGAVVAANIDRLLTDPELPASISLVVEGKHLNNTLGTPAKHRDGPAVMIEAGWRGTEHTARFTAVTDDMNAALRAGGVISSVSGNIHSISDVTSDIVVENYGPETYQRLAELKAAYDPENIFHLNYNIEPAGPKASNRLPEEDTK
ncbi:FAD-binding oxidoreductase [Rhodococcus sp. NPDC057014]|uniref:FAD-binding oxidoreductase n=1 Tax=Rhodococcus sp. NPDC057014 TaxID=3346000 RepID=UPI0036315348